MNRDVIGRVYPGVGQFRVTPVLIGQFAEALGDDNPLHQSTTIAETRGYPGVVAPPTFPVVALMRLAGHAIFDPELGLNFKRVTAGQETCVQHRPIFAGDTLRSRTCVEDVRNHSEYESVMWRSDIIDEDDQPVCTWRTTFLERQSDTWPRLGRPTSLTESHGAETLASREIAITRRNVIRYCAVSGDFNDIHWSDSAARAVGLPCAVAHGLLTLGAVTRVVTNRLAEPEDIRGLGARFIRPVPVPDNDDGVSLDVAVRRRNQEESIHGGDGLELELDVSLGGQPVLALAYVQLSLPKARRSVDREAK